MVENGDDKQRIQYAEMCNSLLQPSKESNREHQEIQPTDHTRHDIGIKGSEEIHNNAESRPRQTDHTPRQAG